jgi:NhaB family Na+:H+ antiporter
VSVYGRAYEEQQKDMLLTNETAMSREHYEHLAVAINMGTNLPSCATPNGQAAFLFILTSAIAPLVHLSYGQMVYMALPYTFVLAIAGSIGVIYLI